MAFIETKFLKDIVENSHLFEMDAEDIILDENIKDKELQQNENILVFQRYINNKWERYCYLKISTSVGLDNKTKCVNIKQVIIDVNVIDNRLFCKLIYILLQQISNEFNNRIIVGNKDLCFKNNVVQCADEVGNYIYDLLAQENGEIVFLKI